VSPPPYVPTAGIPDVLPVTSYNDVSSADDPLRRLLGLKPSESVNGRIDFRAPCPCGADATWWSYSVMRGSGDKNNSYVIDCPRCQPER
jgi:hypothetical protein